MSLILFSGLAADEQVFAPQKLAIPELQVPGWLVPQLRALAGRSDGKAGHLDLPISEKSAYGETLDHYAQRMSESLHDLKRPLWIGGASFGGILALHMARHLKPDGVILLGSVRGPNELPPYVRRLRRWRGLVPYVPIRPWQLTLAPILMALAGQRLPRLHGAAAQLRRADPRVIRWSIGCLLDWQTTPEVECSVHQLHGQRDIVLPARYTQPTYLIPGGGHIVSLTHPQLVTDYLKKLITVP